MVVGELVGGKSVVGAEGLGLLGELVNRNVPDLRNIRKEGGGNHNFKLLGTFLLREAAKKSFLLIAVGTFF